MASASRIDVFKRGPINRKQVPSIRFRFYIWRHPFADLRFVCSMANLYMKRAEARQEPTT